MRYITIIYIIINIFFSVPLLNGTFTISAEDGKVLNILYAEYRVRKDRCLLHSAQALISHW